MTVFFLKRSKWQFMAGVPVINQSPITFFLSLLFLAASLFCASRRSVCQNPHTQRSNGQPCRKTKQMRQGLAMHMKAETVMLGLGESRHHPVQVCNKQEQQLSHLGIRQLAIFPCGSCLLPLCKVHQQQTRHPNLDGTRKPGARRFRARLGCPASRRLV